MPRVVVVYLLLSSYLSTHDSLAIENQKSKSKSKYKIILSDEKLHAPEAKKVQSIIK
jgi:hypothetical protein